MNIRTRLLNFPLFAIVLCCSVANAYGPWYGEPGRPVGYGGYGAYGAGYGYGGYGYGGGNGGVGGAASGMANLVNAQGQRNVSNSQAAINYEEANIEKQKAISAAMDNMQKYRDNRDLRMQKAEARDAANRQAEMESQARFQKYEADHRPPPLSPSQLEPSTGKIEWPSALRSVDFKETRTAIDALFKTQAESGPSDDLSVQMHEQVRKLQDQLRKQVTQIPLPEYSQSRKFLDRLANSFN